MRVLVFTLLLITACDKPVSEDQRRAIREEMQKRKPVKISDEQILSKTFEMARADLKDSAVTQYQWKEFYVKPADSLLSEIWLAYQYAIDAGVKITDNVQLTDSIILYTMPVVKMDSLRQMHVAIIPKKEVVLKITIQ